MMSYRAFIYRFNKFLQKFNAREQILLMLVALLIAGALGQTLLTLWKLQNPKDYIAEQQQLTQTVESLETAIAEIRNKSNQIDIKGLRQRKDSLEKTNLLLERKITETANYLIPPDKMAALLEQLLTRYPGLTVVKLKSIAPEAVEVMEEESEIFQHKMEIEINGSFTELTAWLKEIETLPWVINWDLLDYEMTVWPQGILYLELHTLSQQREFIGV